MNIALICDSIIFRTNHVCDSEKVTNGSFSVPSRQDRIESLQQ